MIEWFETLGYGAEGRRLESGFAQEGTLNTAVNVCLFRVREGYSIESGGLGFSFHMLCPKYGGSLLRPLDKGKPLTLPMERLGCLMLRQKHMGWSYILV